MGTFNHVKKNKPTYPFLQNKIEMASVPICKKQRTKREKEKHSKIIYNFINAAGYGVPTPKTK